MAAAGAAGLFVVPTLTVLESFCGAPGGKSLCDDVRLTPYLHPEDHAALQQSFPGIAGFTLAAAEAGCRRFAAAGLPVLAGTDAPNPGTVHGASLHRELELLVGAGLSPVEALRAATSVPARVFGLADRGLVAPGLRADLVLVEGDPRQDITHTRAIVGVWKRGMAIDRIAYREEVAARQS